MSVIPLAGGYLAGMIPWRLGGALALAGATFVGGWHLGAQGVRGQWAAEHAKQAQQQVEAAQEALRFDTTRTRHIQQEQDHARQAAAVARADAVGARTELGRLRDTLAANQRAADAPAAVCRLDVATAERELLGACAAAVSGMAEEADEVRSRLIELQGWARAVSEPASAP